MHTNQGLGLCGRAHLSWPGFEVNSFIVLTIDMCSFREVQLNARYKNDVKLCGTHICDDTAHIYSKVSDIPEDPIARPLTLDTLSRISIAPKALGHVQQPSRTCNAMPLLTPCPALI